jgi:hypothetical protein
MLRPHESFEAEILFVPATGAVSSMAISDQTLSSRNAGSSASRLLRRTSMKGVLDCRAGREMFSRRELLALRKLRFQRLLSRPFAIKAARSSCAISSEILRERTGSKQAAAHNEPYFRTCLHVPARAERFSRSKSGHARYRRNRRFTHNQALRQINASSAIRFAAHSGTPGSDFTRRSISSGSTLPNTRR